MSPEIRSLRWDETARSWLARCSTIILLRPIINRSRETIVARWKINGPHVEGNRYIHQDAQRAVQTGRSAARTRGVPRGYVEDLERCENELVDCFSTC